MVSEEKRLSNMLRYPAAAEFLGISPATLRRKVMLHQVPFMRPFGFKGRVLFDPLRLEEFAKQSAVEPVAS
jgi:hypothetical protein